MKPRGAMCMMAWVVTGWLAATASNDLVTYPNATLVEHPANDGDSFFVLVDGQELHIRLYFVDTPETVAYHDYDARRMQEQAGYFGLDQPERVIWLGRQAAGFTKEVLSKPFTVYTSHARALGGRSSSRIYGFVVTSTGRDLGELLVENGLGRNFGVKRERYDGLSQNDVEVRLRDIEAAAMLARRGIWQESNPERLAEYRARQREAAASLNALMSSTITIKESPLDLNTATQAELERIPGVGPVMANRIISGRPYRDIEDLRSVRGIGDKMFESIRPFVRAVAPTNG